MSEQVEQVEQVQQVPEIELVEIWLNSDNFHAALAAVSPARESSNSYRPILECFHVEIVNDSVTVTTTDSYICMQSTYREILFSSKEQSKEKHAFLVGQNVKLADLKSVLTEKTVRLEITKKTVTLSTLSRSHLVTLSITEGEFPNTASLFSEAAKREKSKEFSEYAFNSAIFSKVLSGQKAFLKVAKEKPENCPIRVMTTDSLKPGILRYSVPDFGDVVILLMPIRIS